MTKKQLEIRTRKLAHMFIQMAEFVMPDAFLESDTRVRYARETLKLLGGRRPPRSL